MDQLKINLESKAQALNLDELLSIYLQNQEIFDTELLLYFKILISCAIYLGCQTVKLLAMNGQETYGNCVTLTQVIRQLAQSIDIEDFLDQLKSFLRSVSHVVPVNLKNEMEAIIAQSIVNYRIYKKFEKALSDEAHTPWFANDSFQATQNALTSPPSSVHNLTNSISESQEFRNLAWIIFLMLKYEIIHQDEMNEQSREIMLGDTPERKNTLVLMAHLSLIMLTLRKQERQQLDVDEAIKLVASVITPSFVTDQIEFFDEVRQLMKRCSDQMKRIKNSHQLGINSQQSSVSQYDDIFQEQILKSILKKFHVLYEKDTRKYNLHLDEECFLRQKLIFTPHKKSAKQSGSKNETNNKPLALARIDKEFSKFEPLKKKVKCIEQLQPSSPTFKGIMEPLFCFTPQPAQKSQIRMYNLAQPEVDKQKEVPYTPLSGSLSQAQWFKITLTKKNQQAIQALNNAAEQISRTFMEDLKNQATQKIRDYINKMIELGRMPKMNKIQEDCENIVQFYEQVLRKMLIQTEDNGQRVVNFLYYDTFLNSLLAACIDTYDFIYQRKGDIQILLQKCGISSVEMWRVISNFANFDQKMPEQVSKHLLELEGKLLLFVVWQDCPQEILAILIKRYQGIEQLRYYEETLLRRLRSHAALRVMELATVLKIDETYIKEDTWSYLQSILGNPPNCRELFHQRHIDMFIICSFYMILKYKQQERTFELFRKHYSSAFHQDVQFVFAKIIQFYNGYFLKYFKYMLRSGGPSTPQPKSFNSQASPLVLSIPQAFLEKSNFVQQNQRTILPEFKPIEENNQLLEFKPQNNFKDKLKNQINSKETKL